MSAVALFRIFILLPIRSGLVFFVFSNISTSRALEINCALTRRKITFYAKHEWALDRWVEAVKLESASDDLLFDDSLQGTPLPPSVEWLLSSDANLDKEFFSDKGRISSPSASSTREVFLKKNEVHVAQGDTVMDSIVSHVPSSLLSSSRSTPAKTRSPLLTEKVRSFIRSSEKKGTEKTF